MRKLIVILLASLIASSSLAVIDPEPNMIGIYFDPDADYHCAYMGPNIPLTAYLILTNTTAPTVVAYELAYTNVVPAGMEDLFVRTSSLIANGVVSGLDLGDSSNFLAGEHIVGLASPIMCTPATVLHTWRFEILASNVTVEMFISSTSFPSIPGPFPVIMTWDGTIFTAGQSTGGPDIPVASINVDCAVGVEESSFGSVKSLFR